MHPTPAATSRPPRSYRCSYMPLASNGHPIWNAEGLYPCIQIQATDAVAAHYLAHVATGAPVVAVERIEGVVA